MINKNIKTTRRKTGFIYLIMQNNARQLSYAFLFNYPSVTRATSKDEINRA